MKESPVKAHFLLKAYLKVEKKNIDIFLMMYNLKIYDLSDFLFFIPLFGFSTDGN